ncbi:MAG: ribulokinase [Actinobacteria bacterium]|nr:ribulokinase [Actinomycetota bacterium]
MHDGRYVMGIDFGTDSVRSLIVNVKDGKEEAAAAVNYKRWSQGRYSDSSKNMFRHHPLDYLESMQEVVSRALESVPGNLNEKIIGIGVDTTGSTPAPVDKNGTVLALKKEFEDNPDAMFILWKDHTAVEEAEQINNAARSRGGVDYTKYSGGTYSPEWFFSKILHILRSDKNVRKEAYSWVELADWIPAVLTGNTNLGRIKRSRCAAGHKAMWHREWGGLPSEGFLFKVDPLLSGLRERLYTDTFTSENKAGRLTAGWAEKLGLNEGIAVTVGAIDAHMGAVGAGISEGVFVKITGTSSCDMAVGPKKSSEKLIAGICGQVDGSIIPGMIGYEAGQSSFGDVYAWFKDILSWPLKSVPVNSKIIDIVRSKEVLSGIEGNILRTIEKEAARIRPQDTGIISLDWLNGRRTPFADPRLKGVVAGLSLGSTAPKIYRSLAEATAFGSKAIVGRFLEEGLSMNEVTAIGGVSQKSPFVMQILADVLDIPVKVAKSSEAIALGAAIFASVASGYYGSVEEARKNMASSILVTYYPDNQNVRVYKKLYDSYIEMGIRLEDFLRKL